MQLEFDSPYTFSMEVGVLPEQPSGEAPAVSAFAPLHHEDITADLADLVDEAFVGGVLADRIDPSSLGSGPLAVAVRPVWSVEPVADRIRIEVSAGGSTNGSSSPAAEPHVVEFKQGRWTRRVGETLRRLRSDKLLGEKEQAYVRVVALRGDGAPELPSLQAPEVTDQTLAELGVRSLGEGTFDPDRPILVNQRAVDEIIERTIAAGPSEAGGGMLGKLVRLPEALEGTRSRVVTVLTTSIPDDRHEGAPGRLSFSADALVQAQGMAEMRGLGESVLTAYHSHGWGTGCDECNQSAGCTLPSVELVSGDDYQVLESLFPGKATLMPIAGRKPGATGRRPVLEIHAWSVGAMSPVAWRAYTD